MLRDGRDDPYITHRAQTESVTFLGNQSENTRNLYAIPGLDYVAHEGKNLNLHITDGVGGDGVGAALIIGYLFS